MIGSQGRSNCTYRPCREAISSAAGALVGALSIPVQRAREDIDVRTLKQRRIAGIKLDLNCTRILVLCEFFLPEISAGEKSLNGVPQHCVQLNQVGSVHSTTVEAIEAPGSVNIHGCMLVRKGAAIWTTFPGKDAAEPNFWAFDDVRAVASKNVGRRAAPRLVKLHE